MKELKFKGQYIADESDKEIAGLSVREHVHDEKYVVYLKNLVDYMSADMIRQYIDAANALETQSIVQAQMVKSFKQQLESKLHDCLMQTNPQYRYEFEIKQLKEENQRLQEQLAEERKRRWNLENEVFELKQSLQDSEDECESEYEN